MHTRSNLKIRFQKKLKMPKEKVVDLLGELYVESMKTKVAKSKSGEDDRSETRSIARAGAISSCGVFVQIRPRELASQLLARRCTSPRNSNGKDSDRSGPP
jgi:hypothetical protein